MSDRPPSRWLRVVLLVLLLLPAAREIRERERHVRSDTTPDLVTILSLAMRARTEDGSVNLPLVIRAPEADLAAAPVGLDPQVWPDAEVDAALTAPAPARPRPPPALS